MTKPHPPIRRGLHSGWLVFALVFATLRAAAFPVIVEQPKSVFNAPLGETVEFRVVAEGKELLYRWRHNGMLLPNQRESVLTIDKVQLIHGGVYEAIVFDAEGVAKSDPAVLIFELPAYEGVLFDFFAEAREKPVTDPSGLVGGDNRNATFEPPNEPDHADKPGGHSLWMAWIAPEQPGFVEFDTSGSRLDTVLAAYEGEELGKLIPVESDDDSGIGQAARIRFSFEPQKLYFIALDGLGGEVGDFVFRWQAFPSFDIIPRIVDPPLSQVLELDGQQGTQLVVGFDPPQSEVQWFFNGQLVEGGTDNVLPVDPGKGPIVGSYRARLTFRGQELTQTNFTEPVEIQLNRIDGKVAPDVFAHDKFRDLAEPPGQSGATRPPGTIVLNGAPARGYSGTQVFSTVGSTADPFEPVHCGVAGGVSEWFGIIAEANGVMTVDTFGSDFDTVLAIYTDPVGLAQMSDLEEVTCNDDASEAETVSQVQFTARAGELYYVSVDGKGGATGTAYLNFALNLPPTIGTPANQNILEDESTGVIAFTVGDNETNPDDLVVTATSLNTVVVAHAGIILGGSGAARTVQVTPLPDAFGWVSIRLRVQDGDGGERTSLFNVTVTPVNDQPTLGAIGAVILLEDAQPIFLSGITNVNLSGITSGAANEPQVLSVSAVSSNPGVIPDPAVTYTSPNTTGTLTLSPVPDAFGSATITVTVTDDGGTANGGVDTRQRMFTVNVAPVNDPPTLGAIGNRTIDQDSGLQTVELTGISSGAANETQVLTITAVSDTPGLIPHPAVDYSSPAATGSISFAPASGQSGSAVITVRVEDDGGTDAGGSDFFERDFTVNITGFEAPTITLQPVSRTALTDEMLSLTVAASGYPEPVFLWFHNDAPPVVNTFGVYHIGTFSAADAGEYYAIASNSVGIAESALVNLYLGDDLRFVSNVVAGGVSHLRLVGPMGNTFTVEAADNGAAGDWTGVISTTPLWGILDINDPHPTIVSNRIYRALIPAE